MSELLDPTNVALFAARRRAVFGAGLFPYRIHPCDEVEPYGARIAKECWRNTEWGLEKPFSPMKKAKSERIGTFRVKKPLGGPEVMIVCQPEDPYMERQNLDIERIPLDQSLVKRYHELAALEARGVLSRGEREELAKVEQLLDEQERTVAQECTSGLDQDLERLKQLIELNRQVGSLL
jgi:hypothetical protein